MFRKLLAGASAVVVTASLSLLALAAPADAATGSNPLAPALGFTVLTQGDATTTGGSETQGAWAVGGDLHVAQQYTFGTPVGGQSIPTLGGTTTQVVLGGGLVLGAGGEATSLNGGALRVATTAGYTVTQGNRFTAPGGSAWARMNASEPIETVTSSLYAMSFANAFASLQASAAAIHALGASSATMLTLIDPTNVNGLSGSDKGIQLVAGTPNVLRVTAAQLTNVQNLKLLGGVAPSASTPLYVDVTDAGAVSMALPTIMAGNGTSADASTIARFSLFDFASATSVGVRNGDRIEGAILAPNAAVSLTGGTYEGQIVAKTFTVSSSRELHGYVFGGTLPTPPAKDASASVSTTPATCTTAEALVLGQAANATWGTATRTTGPGAYSVTATATSGHAFADGTTTNTFTGTLAAATTANCGPQVIAIRAAPSYTPATCSAGGSLVVPTQDHIVWSGGVNGAGPGSYTVTARVDDPASYTLGSARSSWTVVVPAAGTNADGTSMSCVATDCLPNSAVSYTYDASTNGGVITVTNPNPSKYTNTLCSGFYVTATGWKYTTTGVWPQKLAGYQEANNGTKISGVGTYPYGYPVACGQGDIYAAVTPVPIPTGVLNGPSTPYAEHFLHDMGFRGPTPTYTQTAHGTCNVLDAKVIAPSATAITACGQYGSITTGTDPRVTYALTAGDGRTGHAEVTATAVSPWVFADNTTTHVYAFELGSYVDCVTPVATLAHGACTAHGTDPSTETVTFTFDNRGSTRAVVFAVPSQGISVTVAAGSVATATAEAPEAGASYLVTADGAPLTTLTVPGFTGCRESLVGDPSSTPATCVAGVPTDGSITVDLKPSLVYTITNEDTHAVITPTAATTAVAPGHYTVTVAAVPGYVLNTGATVWPYTVTIADVANCGVAPVAPTASTVVTCQTDGSYTLPDSGDLWTWTVASNGGLPKTDVAKGTYPAHAQFFDSRVVVTAVPMTGVQFAPGATTSWTFDYTAPASCLPTLADFTIEWSSTPAVCTAGVPQGTITVGPDGFLGLVDYRIDGTPVTSATTAVAPGAHVLTASPVDPADTVDNPGPHTITVAAAAGDCTTQLKTLALTGSDPTAWIIGALALLQLGLALLAVRFVRGRRSGRHLA